MNARARSVTVIGGGPGGYVAAIRAAGLGLDVRLVERGSLGGTCLNVGCIPSKALLHAVEQRRRIAEGPQGLGVSLGPVDLGALQGWKSGLIERLRGGVAGLLRSAGVDVVRGEATLETPDRVIVTGDAGTTNIESDAIILATGSRPVELDALPVDRVRVMSSSDALELAELPRRVAIVGAGYIGLELATALHGLGSEVIVLEASDRVLPGIHPGAADVVRGAMSASGIDIRLGVRVVGDDGTRLEFIGADGSSEHLPVDRVIVAVGRRPNSSGLGLERLGVSIDPSGAIPVDDWCRTSSPSLYAIGDLTSGPALAHRASAQGEIVAEHLAGGEVPFRPAAVPAVVYTSPEIATVGLTVEEAAAVGSEAVEHRFSFAGNARALVNGDEHGVAFVVSDTTTGRILGMHLVGDGVGEMIAVGALALEMGAVLDDLGDTIFPHPTVSEVVRESVSVARGRPLHAAGGDKSRNGARGR